MPEFGDADPEDAWDPDDPVAELAANLARRAGIIHGRVHGQVHPLIRLRLSMLADDLAHLAARLEAF